MRAPSQRRALGALFAVLCLAFAGLALYAASARVWVIAIAAGVLALWLAGFSLRSLGGR